MWAADFPGAFTRGEKKEIAVSKMEKEIASYCTWANREVPVIDRIVIVQDAQSDLDVEDADTDVLFESEKQSLIMADYILLKGLVLKSASDFLALYNSIPDKTLSYIQERRTFYGQVPCTADEMYMHTKNVNEYYFREIGVEAGREESILACRQRGLKLLEEKADFLSNTVFNGSYGELWSLRKMLRRFLWHDRIHARAMYKMAVRIWGDDAVPDIFLLNV